MPNFTPNLNLIKPLGTENFSVSHANNNADKVDEAFGEVTAQFEKMAYYVTPNGTDDTDSVVDAWKNNDSVVFKSGIYVIDIVRMWQNKGAFKIPNDTTLTWEEGAIFTPKSNAYDSTSFQLFLYIDSENVTLNSPNIIGDIDYHTAWETSSSQRQGFGILMDSNCKNVTINNPKVRKMLADGIFVKGDNIVINSPILDKNRRNGMVIEEGDTIIINNPVISNSGSSSLNNGKGLGPGAGIDIEPISTVTKLRNIVINNPLLINNLNTDTNNGAGGPANGSESASIFVSLNSIGLCEDDISVTINNPILKGSGIMLTKPSIQANKGNLRIVSPFIENSISSGIACINSENPNFEIEINNPFIENWNTYGSPPSIYRGGIVFSRDATSAIRGIENVKIMSPILKNEVYENQGIVLQDNSTSSSTGTAGIKNFEIANPSISGIRIPLSLDNERDRTFKIYGGNVEKIITSNKEVIDTFNSFLTYYVNALSQDVIIAFSASRGTFAEEFYISNDNSNSVELRFQNFDGTNRTGIVIPNFASQSIYGLRTTAKGANLRFKKSGNNEYSIISLNGTWEVLTTPITL